MSNKRFKKFKNRGFDKPIHPEDNPDWPARNSLVAFISQSMQELQHRAYDGKKTWGDGVLVATYDARDDSTQTHWLGYGTAKDLTRMFDDEMAGHLMTMGEVADETGCTILIAEFINSRGGSQRCTTCIEAAPRPSGTTEHMRNSSFSRN